MGRNRDWEPESDHDSADAAADRVRYLNGGELPPGRPATEVVVVLTYPDVEAAQAARLAAIRVEATARPSGDPTEIAYRVTVDGPPADASTPGAVLFWGAPPPIPGRMGAGTVAGDDEESLVFADEDDDLDGERNEAYPR
jgi:hypothetical protein